MAAAGLGVLLHRHQVPLCPSPPLPSPPLPHTNPGCTPCTPLALLVTTRVTRVLVHVATVLVPSSLLGVTATLHAPLQCRQAALPKVGVTCGTRWGVTIVTWCVTQAAPDGGVTHAVAGAEAGSGVGGVGVRDVCT
jgi:hypothetical protein